MVWSSLKIYSGRAVEIVLLLFLEYVPVGAGCVAGRPKELNDENSLRPARSELSCAETAIRLGVLGTWRILYKWLLRFESSAISDSCAEVKVEVDSNDASLYLTVEAISARSDLSEDSGFLEVIARL